MTPVDRLSPRQRDCLRLVWEKAATSKEIAAELGISKKTVDGYIADAVQLLGVADRREAARFAFADQPRTVSGGDTVRGDQPPDHPAADPSSTEALPASRPWATRARPRNTLTLAQTLGWIAAIALGSLLALLLATVIGNGVPPVARSVLGAFDRLTH